jgi:hypothetical protein
MVAVENGSVRPGFQALLLAGCERCEKFPCGQTVQLSQFQRAERPVRMEWVETRVHWNLVRLRLEYSYPAAKKAAGNSRFRQAESGIGNCRRSGSRAAALAMVLRNGVKRDGPLKYSSSGYKGYGSNSRKVRPSFCSIR